jgi:hypothetical protein
MTLTTGGWALTESLVHPSTNKRPGHVREADYQLLEAHVPLNVVARLENDCDSGTVCALRPHALEKPGIARIIRDQGLNVDHIFATRDVCCMGFSPYSGMG